jgi:hypothetical protein
MHVSQLSIIAWKFFLSQKQQLKRPQQPQGKCCVNQGSIWGVPCSDIKADDGRLSCKNCRHLLVSEEGTAEHKQSNHNMYCPCTKFNGLKQHRLCKIKIAIFQVARKFTKLPSLVRQHWNRQTHMI